ncbi:hypothetical protein CC86DRAFT_455863 [Ophiobolus disseminans]|uniref:Chitin-binding type-1 domain-containing protein n=1 Tax=Ophiobolus disseminans TaxID=1469910 RepID=A0A6A6ZZB6_9PLEO|nr:hypothetical protein CC86DRAFT_455863 [Ophiobolus disseminans]
MRSSFILALAVLQVAQGTPLAQTISSKISRNGQCGGTSGATCLGSGFGNCCSQYGWCGETTAYCGKGCNSLFGTCSGSSQPSSVSSSRSPSSAATRASSLPAPSSSLVVSTNARCGNLFNAKPGGMTCKGSKYGNCCSNQSYCGKTEAYCGTGCQPGFGDCNAVSSSRAISSSSRASSSSPAPSSSSAISTSTPIAPSSTPSSTPTPAPPSSTPTPSPSETPAPTPTIASSSAPASSAPAVCKNAGNRCTAGDTCCTGTCSAVTFDTSNVCCNAVGGYCNLSNPAGCCSGACLSNNDGSSINGSCF